MGSKLNKENEEDDFTLEKEKSNQNIGESNLNRFFDIIAGNYWEQVIPGVNLLYHQVLLKHPPSHL